MSIARSARRHRLPSEASRRFERGVDPQLPPAAAQLAVELLTEHGGGTADPGVTDVGTPAAPAVIELPLDMPSRIVGVDYPAASVERVLTAIGATVEDRGDGSLRVTPPTWRPDLTTGEDLVEEVARIEGYDAIPSLLPTPPGGSGLTHRQRVRRIVADLLAAQGLSEVWAAPFVGDAQHAALGLDGANAADAGTHANADALTVFVGNVQACVLHGLLGRSNAELDEFIGALDVLRAQPLRGVKIDDGPGDARAVGADIVGGDRPDAGTPFTNRRPRFGNGIADR